MDQPQVVITAGELLGIVVFVMMVVAAVGYAVIGGFFSWIIRATEVKDPVKVEKPKKVYGPAAPATSGKHYNNKDRK